VPELFCADLTQRFGVGGVRSEHVGEFARVALHERDVFVNGEHFMTQTHERVRHRRAEPAKPYDEDWCLFGFLDLSQ
jgi:hypothetical protein